MIESGRVLVAAVGAVVLVGAAELRASPPSFEAIQGNDRYRFAIPEETTFDPAVDVPTAIDGIRFSPLRPRLFKNFPPTILDAGDGSGASISGISLTQVGYAGSSCSAECGGEPCNAVLVLWSEDMEETEGIQIALDGVAIVVVEGLAVDDFPGVSGGTIIGLPAGQRLFELMSLSDGTTIAGSIEVVDVQPFEDPTVSCHAGEIDGEGTCRMGVDIDSPTNGAATYALRVNGVFQGTVNGAAPFVNVNNVPPGDYCVSLQGFLTNQGGTYAGCDVESCCTIACEDSACAPPFSFVPCQAGFGTGPGDNVVIAFWANGEAMYSDGIDGFLDGDFVATIAGDATLGTFGVDLGEHTLGILGKCCADGVYEIVDDSILVLPATPYEEPVIRPVTCVFTEDDGGTTTANWTSTRPLLFTSVFLLSDDQLFSIVTLPGTAVSVMVFPTLPEDRIVLQFFTTLDGSCYGSEFIACEPEAEGAGSYIPGICNGAEKLDISSGVTVLTFLFRGMADPPCRVACDCNGDGSLNIADALCVFGFLFKGDEQPNEWVDELPTCVELESSDDCETPNPVCSSG